MFIPDPGSKNSYKLFSQNIVIKLSEIKVWYPGSEVRGSKMRRVPDLQHCMWLIDGLGLSVQDQPAEAGQGRGRWTGGGGGGGGWGGASCEATRTRRRLPPFVTSLNAISISKSHRNYGDVTPCSVNLKTWNGEMSTIILENYFCQGFPSYLVLNVAFHIAERRHYDTAVT